MRSNQNACIVPESPDGEIGRRSGLKIRRPQGRGGSSPPLGTNRINKLTAPATWPTSLWWETESHPFDRRPHYAIGGPCVSTCEESQEFLFRVLVKRPCPGVAQA